MGRPQGFKSARALSNLAARHTARSSRYSRGGHRAVVSARQLSPAVVLRVDSRSVAVEKAEKLKSDSRTNRHGFFIFGFRSAATFPLRPPGSAGSHNLAGLCHERVAAWLSFFRRYLCSLLRGEPNVQQPARDD